MSSVANSSMLRAGDGTPGDTVGDRRVTGPMETRLPATDVAALPRCAAMVAVGAAMLLGDRVAVATASTTDGYRGDLLAHLDAGRALIVVAVAVAAFLPWLDPNGRESTRTSVVEWLRNGAVVAWSLWTVTVI